MHIQMIQMMPSRIQFNLLMKVNCAKVRTKLCRKLKMLFDFLSSRLGKFKNKTIKVYVNLLDEDVDCMRSTQAVKVENGKYRLLPIENFEISGETWEFEPGSIVSLKKVRATDNELIWLAISAD